MVRYGEIALKSEPTRRRFEMALVNAIRSALKNLSYGMRRERGRLFIDTNSRVALRRLTRVPGIVSVSPSMRIPARMDDVRSTALKIAKSVLRAGDSFAVRTTRIGEHEFSSSDVNRDVGSAILKAIPEVKVNLSAPDKEIFIEIRGGDSYVFTEVLGGVGGLPLGTQGRVLVLFSGSLESALAAFLMMKRGCETSLLYLDPGPHWQKGSRKLAGAAFKSLRDLDRGLEMKIVPYGEVLGRILERVPGSMRCVVCKRSMLRFAQAIGMRAEVDGIVVGEDSNRVGELAPNLRVIDGACRLPVLRPLAGMGPPRIKLFAERAGIRGPSRLCPHRFRQKKWDLTEIQRVEGCIKNIRVEEITRTPRPERVPRKAIIGV